MSDYQDSEAVTAWLNTPLPAGTASGGEYQEYEFTITARLVSQSRQDAWDTWVELLREPMFVENNTIESAQP